MAKRVDFSARSVITADPNISIQELGIPLKIAKNITKPVVVNAANRLFLSKLILNGPDEWPGANKLTRLVGGAKISLKYTDRRAVVQQLMDGDIVHRHMMDGDSILFNRQPTLHRMSMMCHKARIMMRGDTFRMNVADTKPYNADFDGDEMNLHMPQDLEAEVELTNLAAVPYQMISPADNSPIIGIYQDSMLGCYQFTRPGISFDKMHAMDLMMYNPRANIMRLDAISGDRVSNIELLSQIIPYMSLTAKNKKYDADKDAAANANSVIRIRGSEYLGGQIDSGITRKLILRICNEFGNMRAADFIDDLQNLVSEYMKQASFSVGVSDLIIPATVQTQIVDIIAEKKAQVKTLLDNLQNGLFENCTGLSNQDEFENQVRNIMSTPTIDSRPWPRLGQKGRISISSKWWHVSDSKRWTVNAFRSALSTAHSRISLNMTILLRRADLWAIHLLTDLRHPNCSSMQWVAVWVLSTRR
jgi:DNA-directed RNA polymerase II subunit RPB1